MILWSIRQGVAARVTYLMQTYGQPVILEQFIDGREFTVPILGNTPPQALPVIEVLFRDHEYHPFSA